MDREKDNLPKSQAGFITYVVVPMYKPMLAFCPEVVSPMMKNIEDNVTRWKEYADADQVVTIEGLLEAKDFFNKNNYEIETKIFKNCEHRIPTEGSSLGLQFIKKHLY